MTKKTINGHRIRQDYMDYCEDVPNTIPGQLFHACKYPYFLVEHFLQPFEKRLKQTDCSLRARLHRNSFQCLG